MAKGVDQSPGPQIDGFLGELQPRSSGSRSPRSRFSDHPTLLPRQLPLPDRAYADCLTYNKQANHIPTPETQTGKCCFLEDAASGSTSRWEDSGLTSPKGCWHPVTPQVHSPVSLHQHFFHYQKRFVHRQNCNTMLSNNYMAVSWH